jgi:hypothetical protein
MCYTQTEFSLSHAVDVGHHALPPNVTAAQLDVGQ